MFLEGALIGLLVILMIEIIEIFGANKKLNKTDFFLVCWMVFFLFHNIGNIFFFLSVHLKLSGDVTTDVFHSFFS